MKHSHTFAIIVVLAIFAAAFQPGGEPLEVHAAQATADLSIKTICESTACRIGWNTAYANAINDETECRRISDVQEEVRGCRSFVRNYLEERLAQNGMSLVQ